MSMKSTLLLSSLFLILCSQHNPVWADYDSPSIAADDEVEDLQSQRAMAPLLENNNVLPAMKEDAQLPNIQLTAELSTMAQQERLQEFLDQENLADYQTPSALDNDVQDDALLLTLSTKIQFSPNEDTISQDTRDALKSQTMKERIEKDLEKLGPYYQSYFSYQANE